jgi:hypothetical protein
MNSTIEIIIKLSLVWYLIKAGADPLLIPNVRQNAKIKESVFATENQTQIQLLFALLQDSNLKILGDLLKILSINPQFKQKYDEFKISEPGVNQNKNMTIKKLKENNDRLKKILFEVEKQKIIQLNSAIKESALIGSIQPPLSTKQNLASPVSQQKYQSLSQTQNPSQMRYSQNFAVPPTQSFRGGKKITMRTFYLIKHKKYSKQPFKAERPIIAAHNAYDFLKLHDKIGKKQINMTIYDIANNKKYKYTAKTIKDGKNVLKSYK